ncbi:MAG: hypothetical protein AB7U79_01180 [Candidatus Izemoplasmatales bacterium]
MKKKGFIFLLVLLFSFGLVSCTEDTAATTADTSTTETTTTTTSETTQSTTAFSITISGLTDAGYDEKIYTGEAFDLLAGVSAMGSDGVDYVDNILLQSDDAACQIEDGKLTSNSAKVCVITYTVVVNSKIARDTRNVKISSAPVTIDFTETDRFDNDVLFGTDYAITTDDPGVNKFHYWQAAATVLGDTGSVTVADGKLVIVQESMGDVNYALQVIALTEVALEEGRTYKITLTITSTTDRVIDIVTKAPNNDYANDTHSLIEVSTGTADYEMVFVANQDTLHLNIMTGAVEGNLNAGTLEFSNFKLWEGPIVIEYTEVADFFTNTEVAADTAIEFNSSTDTDYVREFYYWDNASGAMMSGTTTADGVDVTLVSEGSNTWENQLQWNDVNKAGTPLIKGGAYKLTFDVNSTVVRTIEVAITGSVNGLPSSASQVVELAVGDNTVTLEFTSLYDYYFMKIMMGNYGDLDGLGTLSFTNFQLFVDVNATPAEEEEGTVVDGVDYWTDEFVTVENGIQNGDFSKEGMVIDADGTDGWTYWTTVDQTWASVQLDATFAITDGKLVATTLGSGGEVWYIQLSYRPTEDYNVNPGATYRVEFDVNASVAGTFSMEMTTTGNVANVAIPVTLVEGDNHVVVEYVAYEENFKLTACLGLYGAAVLTFDNFTIAEEQIFGYLDLEDGIQNGDFSKEGMVIDADATDGWSYWTTVDQSWASVQIDATFAITDGAAVVTTLGTGGEVWYIQFSYRPSEDYNVKPGYTYQVEFDVNASVAGTFSMEMTTTGNVANVAIPVTLVEGANHIVLSYVAYEENFKLTASLGLYGLATLTFDNFTLTEVYQFDNGADVTIQNGDFSKEGMVIDATGTDGWTYWTTVDQSWASTQIDATFAITDGALVVNTLGSGGEVWYIQLSYRPIEDYDVTAGYVYVVEFDVNASVAGTFSFEMTTTGNVANVAVPVTLVEGANHVTVTFVAYEANLKLTACLGLYGVATLTFDNFVINEFVPR